MNLGTATAYIDIDASKFQTGIRSVATGLKTVTDTSESTSDRFMALGNTAQGLGRSLTKGITLPLGAMAVASTKSAIDFESAFAGVKKTVNASEADMKKLETGIRDMAKEMPTAATEIAGVAEAAGQLGIETPNILGFTKTMVMLGDSTNMSAEEAATSLARLANITGMSQNDFDKLGSTIVALGNNMATTESEITAMGLRLAAAGSQIGLTEAETMSFAAALSSVGIEAEAGGTAFSKVMTDIQRAATQGGEKLSKFAQIAGMSAQDFKQAYETDASGALLKFIEGLGKAEEKGTTANAMLDELGITEVRMRDALLRAAGASDVFSEALGIGTQAWEENNALTNEAEQRYETTASKLLILKNNLVEMGITIGQILLPYIQSFVEWLQGLVEKFQALDPSTQEFIVKAGLMAALLGPLLMLFGGLITSVTTITTALSGVSGMFGVTSGAATGASGALAGASAAGAGLAGILGPVLIGALVAMMAKVGESEETLSFLQDKFGGLGTVIGGVCEFMAGIWNITVDNILAKGGLLFDTLAALIDGPGGATVKDAWDKHNKKIEEIGNNAWNNLTLTTTRELSQQKNSVDKETKDAANKADTNTKDMANKVETNSKQASDSMKKNMSATSKVVFDESGKIPQDVQSNMSKSVQAMRQAGSDIYNGMNTSFSKLASQGKQHFSDLYKGTTRSSSKMASQVISDWKSIRGALSKSITGTVEIKVSGYQAALNKISSIKNAASSISIGNESQPATPFVDIITTPVNSDIMQAYDLLRSSDIASYVTSNIPSKIDLNLNTKDKEKQATMQNFNFEFKVDKIVSDSKESANEFADRVIDRMIYKIKREKIALGG